MPQIKYDISDMHSDNYPPELEPYLNIPLRFTESYKHTHTYQGITANKTLIEARVYDYRMEFIATETLKSLEYCDTFDVTILIQEESTDAPT